MLLRTYNTLQKENRLTDSRRQATAQGLWGFTHRAFFFEPLYWSQVAHTAQTIYPTARPLRPMYNFPIMNQLNPLLIQWIFLPKRWIFYQIRQMLNKLHVR
jgi:hypothetical protein